MAESSRSVDVEESKDDCIDDENRGITMLDVLKEEQELEDDAKAVLGASDDQNCTYSRGYVKRQALYACTTCIPHSGDSMKPAGICLACSYHCHEGHELIELYTKRNFRCDCGTSRFSSNKCNLEPDKSAVNDLNKYNQNFWGVYCTCKRPYPDPEDDTEDEMIQCIVCEDWYHGRHLGTTVPPQHDYGEMICYQCMSRHKFLAHYKGYTPTKVVAEEVGDIKVEDESVKNEIRNGTLEENECMLKKVKVPEGEPTTTYFPDGWRKHLCSCDSCKEMYDTEGVSFLLDEQDTVQAYEDRGKANGNGSHFESQYERGMRALSSLDRIQQVEAIEEYNNMKSQLKEYLQKFVESKKVVREEDIREFFSGMEARKKRRVDMPYFCH
ncbi:putative E3 ubiquitin-protein ligase UBR7 [Anabrus simplex]|uniref:putative E3 ubiquitin-protein ligase UBR7 n=1 Tax=Anabrus simplex TaxID=316456 RepID=UPI0035A3935B